MVESEKFVKINFNCLQRPESARNLGRSREEDRGHRLDIKAAVETLKPAEKYEIEGLFCLEKIFLPPTPLPWLFPEGGRASFPNAKLILDSFSDGFTAVFIEVALALPAFGEFF